MLNSVDSNIFANAESVTMVPCISAEWNHNLFNTPYITVAGNGINIASTLTDGTVASVTTEAKENFTTKSFGMSYSTTDKVYKGSVTYSTPSVHGNAYKIITYVKTDSPIPVIVNFYAEGSTTQFGSSQVEATNLGWERVVTYVGSSGADDIISSLDYTIAAATMSGSTVNPILMFTVPEIYETTLFDYRNHPLFPTESPFTSFRPGESYVKTGNAGSSVPSLYRKITTERISNSEEKFYSPVSPILQNPTALFANPGVPTLKHAAPTNDSPYKYFVSDNTSRSISARYDGNISVNKIVIKLNTIATTPKLNISINGTAINSTPISLPTEPNMENKSSGVLVLYWTGSSWSTTPWSDMPVFTDAGVLTKATTINQITVTQASQEKNTPFASYSGSISLTEDFARMHVIEISPRLEVDLSNFVTSFSIDKSLDSKSSNLPISATNSNTASISLSAIPLFNGSSITPIFSSQNNTYNTAISKMLRKGIKFYTGYNLTGYSNSTGNIAAGISSYIPGGVFYSDSWDESDIESVSIQCFDISKYLQSLPAPDYVATNRSAFDVISDILDLAGFTDYDYDSLYSVCNDTSQPLDIYHYSVYSKDTTVIGAINELLMPYQIASYIDEYGIMKFLSLQKIMSPESSSVLSLSESNILSEGFSVQNKSKPGKVSIKYTEPKLKQSLGLRNVNDSNVKSSPSFVYVTSNDILWEQQKIDSVGFQYVKDGIEKDSTTLSTNGADQSSIFYTYNRDATGYAIIEDEVISFEYKEYEMETTKEIPPVPPSDQPTYETVKKLVSIKNNLELQSEITNFIKSNGVSLRISTAAITGAVFLSDKIIYTVGKHYFRVNDDVSITGIDPADFNIKGKISAITDTTFSVPAVNISGSYIAGGKATINSNYDLTTTPTGKITNVRRGLFGTAPKQHKRATSLLSKNLTAEVVSDATNLNPLTSIYNIKTIDPLYPDVDTIKIVEPSIGSYQENHVLVYPTSEIDKGYHTYSVGFSFPEETTSVGGLFFNEGNGDGIYVTFNRHSLINPKTSEEYSPAKYRYIMQIESDTKEILFMADVTSAANFVLDNFPKIVKKTNMNIDGSYNYTYIQDKVWDLQVAWKESDGSNGEEGTPTDKKTTLYVFLNGIKISGWRIPGALYDEDTNPFGTGWNEIGENEKLNVKKNPYLDIVPAKETKFGYYTKNYPNESPNTYPAINSASSNSQTLSYLREIYATVKPLLSRSINYFFQDPEFLNALIQDKPAALNSPSYTMQTTPEIRMINTYDIEYGTPAAISANHSIIQYMWTYYAGKDVNDKGQTYKKLVGPDSISYSGLINTGHRGRIALVNNSSHQVWIKKEADSVNNFSINFTIYTHEAIVPSDPELIEYVVDPGNMSEVVQMDTKWIQSKTSARKVMKLIEQGLSGFAKDISLKIFGNPLLQVGDIVTFSYSLNGISQQKCIVSEISHSFESGLSTSVTLNRIQE